MGAGGGNHPRDWAAVISEPESVRVDRIRSRRIPSVGKVTGHRPMNVADYMDKALEAELNARAAAHPDMREHYADMAISWRNLAAFTAVSEAYHTEFD
jgi:hypothetical protein